jgi:hypothetical protein
VPNGACEVGHVSIYCHDDVVTSDADAGLESDEVRTICPTSSLGMLSICQNIHQACSFISSKSLTEKPVAAAAI